MRKRIRGKKKSTDQPAFDCVEVALTKNKINSTVALNLVIYLRKKNEMKCFHNSMKPNIVCERASHKRHYSFPFCINESFSAHFYRTFAHISIIATSHLEIALNGKMICFGCKHNDHQMIHQMEKKSTTNIHSNARIEKNFKWEKKFGADTNRKITLN